MTEEILYANGDVNVGRSRLQVGDQTYSIRNITSVKTRVRAPDRGGAWFSLGCGGLMLLVGLFALLIAGEVGSGLLLVIPAMAAVALGIHLFRAAKPTFILMLNTAGIESKALESRDRELIRAVEAAIYRAMDQH